MSLKIVISATGLMSSLCMRRHCRLSCSSVNSGDNNFSFDVLSNKVVYKGWRSIIKRDIKLPDGRVSSFDIVSEGRPSVGVFIWNTMSSTTTLLREFHPGTGKMYYGVVGGIYEKEKHTSILQAAQFELEEEAQLQTSDWIYLLNSDSCNVSFDKYSENLLYPYLALDCTKVNIPKPQDTDEFIEVHRDVTYKKLMSIIDEGDMNLFSTYMCFKALRKLEQLNIVVNKDI